MTAREPQSRFADNAGVRLHYIVAGSGPTLLLLHGIPDFSNGWRYQIRALREAYRVAAMDLRGCNRSDKPAGTPSYRISELIGDVVAVIRDLGPDPVTLIGHDWGAILAWWVAMLHPDLVARLATLSAPHPACYLAARDRGELKYPVTYLAQIVAAKPGAPFDPELLSAWVPAQPARAELAEALSRSDAEGLRNLYRANLPASLQSMSALPKVRAPTLILHGARDDFIPPHYYSSSADGAAGLCQVVSVPGAGHFIHHEAAERVNAELLQWLEATG
jgi:pimeloyl-ACP methyl ester carboxylesterase